MKAVPPVDFDPLPSLGVFSAATYLEPRLVLRRRPVGKDEEQGNWKSDLIDILGQWGKAGRLYLAAANEIDLDEASRLFPVWKDAEQDRAVQDKAATPPKVTVLIPSYKHEAFVEKAIHSALAQTLTDLQILVVDDHSPDGTLAAARRVGEARVTVRGNERNLGLGASIRDAVPAIEDAVERFAHQVAASASVETLAAADLEVTEALLKATDSQVFGLILNPVSLVVRDLHPLRELMYAEPEGNLAAYRMLIGWLARPEAAAVEVMVEQLERRDEELLRRFDARYGGGD